MGTTYTVKVVEPTLSESRVEELRQLIDARLEDVNAKMSHYKEDSELSRFNQLNDTTPFNVSPETFEVFRAAIDISTLSNGALDITVGPLVDAWGFGPQDRLERIPTEVHIQALREQTGYELLELDPDALSVRKTTPQIRCDLSAVAKGYGVDRVAEALAGEGLENFMVEVGGEVRTEGLNDSGQQWRIGVERPVTTGRVIEKVISLSGWALATSGDYRNYYEIDGVRYSHMIDPRTGRPITHNLASVSVIDETCTKADGFATALLVLGPDEGYSLAVKEDLAALFLVHEGGGEFKALETPAFEPLTKPK
jgi:thiamine biosynthesis lipoprotein